MIDTNTTVTSTVNDQQARERAVDVSRSCIVQAPAGSGKTSLLVLRYLTLLATVQAPEEIVAITFTRKAAAEMRERIVQALAGANGPVDETSPHRLKLAEAARAVLARDEAQRWGLLDAPGRMRIQTIDSLCHRLAAMSPAVSGIAPATRLEDDARTLFREAALRAIDCLEDGNGQVQPALARVLLHFDNRVMQLVELLVQMLAQRHQWQRAFEEDAATQFCRDAIDRAFARYVDHELDVLQDALGPDSIERAVSLARYASGNLADKPDHELHGITAVTGDLRPRAADLPGWCAIATLLLTKSGSRYNWRKPGGVNVGHGFPKPGGRKDPDAADRQAAKDDIGVLLDGLAVRGDAASLAQMLGAVQAMPAGGFSDADWATVEAFVSLLIIAEHQLQAVFAERDTLDHAEVMSAALRALGPSDAPSDLALAMDYRIRHLLVDEFQDTSVTQVDLLRRLLAGWEPGDGRTLFLVGDPMQSIYAFREAEVGLFLQVQQQGIEQVRPESLYLARNFRSCTQVVDWLNRAFPEVLAKEEDAVLGAVSYRPAEAAMEPAEAGGVQVHPFFDEEGAESDTVVRIVQESLLARPAGTIGILVRSRTHFVEIVPALRDAGIRFQAVKAEPLANRQCVQDLLALTRALIHPADRIAWLAVLRAPWCGMQLADLLHVCGAEKHALICERLADPELPGTLSTHGQAVLQRAWPVLRDALGERLRKPLRRWVEGAWLALGGAASLRDDGELADVLSFFSWLESLPAGELPDPAELENGIAELYARPDPAGDARIQLMTLHNAKGLEFDTVVLPGLDRATRGNDAPLLRWRELPAEAGGHHSDLLVAPLRAAGAEHAAHYQLLQQLEGIRSRNETARLAYVGTTRAKTALHLLGRVATRTGKDGVRSITPPGSGTLLGVLWPAVSMEFEQALQDDARACATPPVAVAVPGLFRLPADWQVPAPPDGLPAFSAPAGPAPVRQPEFEWVGQGARYTGTVIHGLLEHRDAFTVSDAETRARVDRLLCVHGIPAQAQDPVRVQALHAIGNMRTDERAAWLFSDSHQSVQTEYALTQVTAGRLRNCVIDRTFVDGDGVRWIVDYKTGTHAGGDLANFLDEEQDRYREQLEGYARCFAHLEERPCRLALYFPLVPAWREWTYAGEPAPAQAP